MLPGEAPRRNQVHEQWLVKPPGGLGVPITSAFVVGDTVCYLLAAQRARALGVGLLSGGSGREELERAGAYRVYQDPADLLPHFDEVGVRGAE